MSMDTIYYRGAPITATVETKRGMERVQYTPVVCDRPTAANLAHIPSNEVGMIFEDGRGASWGLVGGPLITPWRGTEVLRHLETVRWDTLCKVYHTGIRNPKRGDLERYINSITDQIGQSTYDAIMSTLVPEEIVRAILDNAARDKEQGRAAPWLWYREITDEVRAGTIEWRQEFVDAGVLHPDVVDAHDRAKEEVLTKFKDLLDSHDAYGKYPQAPFSHMVEDILLELAERGIDGSHPREVIVALAGIGGKLAISNFPACGPLGRHYRIYKPAIKEDQLKIALAYSGGWLASRSSMSERTAKVSLRRLFNQHLAG